jgi:hypothetical protein
MKLSDTEKEVLKDDYYRYLATLRKENIYVTPDVCDAFEEYLLSKIDSILEKKEKDIQMSADGKYLSYQGKVYVYEDEKFKELNNK